MKTTEECLDALVKGHTLVNVTGGKVWLDKFGFQCASGMGKKRNGRPYSFSNPDMWEVETMATTKLNMWLLGLIFALLVSIGFNISTYNTIQQFGEDSETSSVSLEETTLLYEQTLSQLKQYQASEEWLEKLGASPEEAKETIKAAEAYRIDPKYLGL